MKRQQLVPQYPTPWPKNAALLAQLGPIDFYYHTSPRGNDWLEARYGRDADYSSIDIDLLDSLDKREFRDICGEGLEKSSFAYKKAKLRQWLWRGPCVVSNNLTWTQE